MLVSLRAHQIKHATRTDIPRLCQQRMQPDRGEVLLLGLGGACRELTGLYALLQSSKWYADDTTRNVC